jgi:3-hydroxyisobutyrate dehydrogenase
MRIGIVGLGRMGTAMGLRLLESGCSLVVWNRTAARAAPLLAAGATWAPSPAALAAQVDLVITIMMDATGLDAVFRGPDGLLCADLAGVLVMEMSTVRPTVEIALAEAVQGRGGAFIDCPVGGTVGPARAGKLLGLAGGEAGDVDRARPVLDQLCRRLAHCGPVGAGAAMKLAINLPLAVSWQALGEALTLVRHLGRDPAWLMDVIADSSGATMALKGRAQSVAEALAGGDGGVPAFDLAGVAKDLRTMVEEGASRGSAMPVSQAALAIYEAVGKAGFGGRDITWMPAFWPSRPTPATLTLEAAGTIVDVALARGRALNLAPLTVAVLDAGGHPMAFKREDGAPIPRFDIPCDVRVPICAADGAVRGTVMGTVLGAVGLSGDDSGQGEACALAGLRAAGFTAQTGG